MTVDLCDIPDVNHEWETVHRIRALVINGKSPALDKLAEWKKNNRRDYNRLMRSMKLACQNKRVTDPKYVQRSKNRKCSDVYELRAAKGNPRLFFFFSPDESEIIVCTHGWGKKSSRREQNKEFEKCNRFRELFMRCYK